MPIIETLNFSSVFAKRLLHISDLYDKGVEERQELEKLRDFSPFRNYREICPYCGSEVKNIYAEIAGLEYWNETWGWYGYECSACSWWWNYEESGNWGAAQPEVHVGALYKTQEPPVELLSAINAIGADSRILYKMNPTKFEQFVGGILKEFYDCEVLHIGRSHDGGIDLILLDSNGGKMPIQVKRRTSKSKTESVSLVREFRGAMLLHGYNSGMILTTADHFSKEAVEASQPKPHHSLQQTVDLIDARRLLDIMELIGKRTVTENSIRLRFGMDPPVEVLTAILARINKQL
jgi:Restriction endonuclease